jgi:tetratricopeptide (TPR) repeat protein
VPLALLEVWLRVRENRNPSARIGAAVGLIATTLVMGAGTIAVAAAVWIPQLQAAFDDRRSLLPGLAQVMSAQGVESAVRQYRELKAAEPTVWNFDENQLNNLGYTQLRAGRLVEAIRLFELNVGSYPQSANVYDSLAEAQLAHGDRDLAIANYRKSLQLNPRNAGAAKVLQRLGGS